jgi:hypothetical protein
MDRSVPEDFPKDTSLMREQFREYFQDKKVQQNVEATKKFFAKRVETLFKTNPPTSGKRRSARRPST